MTPDLAPFFKFQWFWADFPGDEPTIQNNQCNQLGKCMSLTTLLLDLATSFLQRVVEQCTLMIFEVGLFSALNSGATSNKCIATSNRCLTSSNKKLCMAILQPLGRPSRRERILRSERKLRVEQRRRRASIFLLYLTIWPGVEGALRSNVLIEDSADWSFSWELVHQSSVAYLQNLCSRLEKMGIHEENVVVSSMMQEGGTYAPLDHGFQTLAPINEADFFDLNRGGGFVMIWAHTFLWGHQMQLNSFRVPLRLFRERPMLGGSWLRDLLPMGSMWQDCACSNA